LGSDLGPDLGSTLRCICVRPARRSGPAASPELSPSGWGL